MTIGKGDIIYNYDKNIQEIIWYWSLTDRYSRSEVVLSKLLGVQTRSVRLEKMSVTFRNVS